MSLKRLVIPTYFQTLQAFSAPKPQPDNDDLLHCCLTSTEARWLIRDGGRVGRGRESEGSTAEEDRRDRGPPPEQWKC